MRVALTALLLVMSIASDQLSAQVFRCQEADGTLTYSQTPCAEAAAAAVTSSTDDSAPPDCSYANRFAFATARTMQGGVSSAELFKSYGGLDALSRSSLGIINYVYSFRTASDVSAERIAGLAQAKCEVKSFGAMSCEALPPVFTEQLGGCSPATGSNSSQPILPAQGQAMPRGPQPAASGAGSASGSAATARDREAVEQCKKRYRDQIDAIDAEMRRGYSSEQGESYRERLRGLTERLRAC